MGRIVTGLRRVAFAIVFLLLVPVLGACELGAPDPQPGADGLGDAYVPQLGNGGYDVQAYDLDLVWDNLTNVLSGTATVEAMATIDLSAFNLDFYGFTIEDVTVNGAPSTFSREGHE